MKFLCADCAPEAEGRIAAIATTAQFGGCESCRRMVACSIVEETKSAFGPPPEEAIPVEGIEHEPGMVAQADAQTPGYAGVLALMHELLGEKR